MIAASGDTLNAKLRSLEAAAQTEAEQLLRHTDRHQLENYVVSARSRCNGEPRRHAVPVPPDRWPDEVGQLLIPLLDNGCLSRGAVVDAGKQHGRNWPLFLLSFAWGYGGIGYGPARLARICETADERAVNINEQLDDALTALDQMGPVAGYERLLGAIPYCGPAFFTKWLYFADHAGGASRALILDNRVANRIQELSGMRWLVTRRRTSYRWTAYRYATYLAWTHGAADELTNRTGMPVPADLVELALFSRAARHEHLGTGPPASRIHIRITQ